MPLKKKHTVRNRIIIWTIIIAIVVLMIISFPHVQHTTEIVLFQ